MLIDTITLSNGSVIHNATIESGTALPSTNLTVGELFYLTSGTTGLYAYNGTSWILTQVTKTSQLTNDSNFITSTSPSITGRTQSDAYSYTVSALGNVSGTTTMDLGTAGEFTMTITGATTFAFTNTLAANHSEVVLLRITNGGSATITWPASTKFASATAPTLTASGTDVLGVKYDTTTSTYMVFVVGLAVA